MLVFIVVVLALEMVLVFGVFCVLMFGGGRSARMGGMGKVYGGWRLGGMGKGYGGWM